MNFHEALTRDHDDAPVATERSFGTVMTVAFALVSLAPLLHGHPWRPWALLVAAAFAAVTFAAPRALAPANRLWMALGRLLHRVVSPIIMALLFALVVVPTGLALRLAGKDPLRLKRDATASTYWQQRMPPGPVPGSLKQQF